MPLDPVQTCPRRMFDFGPWERTAKIDSWQKRGDRLCCSFCGSLHPDDAIEMLTAGALLIPTDKNYKIYVGDAHEKVYFHHFEEKHQQALLDLLNGRKLNFAQPGYFYRLPFFLGITTP